MCVRIRTNAARMPTSKWLEALKNRLGIRTEKLSLHSRAERQFSMFLFYIVVRFLSPKWNGGNFLFVCVSGTVCRECILRMCVGLGPSKAAKCTKKKVVQEQRKKHDFCVFIDLLIWQSAGVDSTNFKSHFLFHCGYGHYIVSQQYVRFYHLYNWALDYDYAPIADDSLFQCIYHWDRMDNVFLTRNTHIPYWVFYCSPLYPFVSTTYFGYTHKLLTSFIPLSDLSDPS